MRARALLLAAATTATSCGGGTAVISYWLTRHGSSNHNSPTVISDVSVSANTKRSPITVSFRLTDPDSDPLSVEILVVDPSSGTNPALLVGDTNLSSLPTSPSGVTYQRQWDFASQLATGSAFVSGLELEVRKAGSTKAAVSPTFSVGNDPPTVSITSQPPGELAGPVPIDLQLADSSSDLVDVTIEYADLLNPAVWKPATPLGTTLQQVASTPAGVSALFLWDVSTDEPHRAFTGRLRFTPTDTYDVGSAATTSDLTIDNNSTPTVLVDGSGFFADPDSRRGIPLRYQAIDAEGDPLRVVFQWAAPGEGFPTLPTDPAALAPILTQPDLRRQYQIATERPASGSGHQTPQVDGSVQLHEMGAIAAAIGSEFLVGRTLEVLATPSAPAARAASWALDPLTIPVAALPYGDGHTALVLERPFVGNWQLREIDLATGSIVRSLASGADGDPSALAWLPDSSAVLVATSAAGLWQLFAISAADGTRSSFFDADAAAPAGSVRGVVATGATSAIVAVAGSLLQLDHPSGLPQTWRTLLQGLTTPTGVALDPTRGGRLYFSEADWVNPATSTVTGRLSILDLVTLVRTDLVSTGLALTRPTAIALERGGTRLLAITNSNTSDGTRELCAVNVGHGVGGVAYQVVAGLPDDVNSVSAGLDDLRLLTLPSEHDLAVGGGLQQVRTITSFDWKTDRVTVDVPFAPPLDPRQIWRIHDGGTILPAGATTRKDAFVWDSSDLPTGGDVVLRATPYDTDVGLATDTGVPRTVKAAIDVLPLHIGGAASTGGASGLALGDLNGDGVLDLVTANASANSATIFFQDGNHRFPATPNVTLQGINLIAPMQQPVAVCVVDVDADGDLDLVTANHASNNLSVATQISAGTFQVQPLSLGTGITGPTDVVAADLNGDGRVDLACSNDGSNNVALFYQLAGGLYSPAPSATLGDASTLGPSALDAGDVDGDGRIDLVVALRTSNRIAVFLQASAGGFPTSPSFLLGGAGLTDGPSSVRLVDLNRDGRLDIVCANGAGNNVAVFLQSPSGGFSSTPTQILAGSGGPVGPGRIAVGDVNGDGSLDLVVPDSNNSISVFLQDPLLGTFSNEALLLRGANDVLDPVAAVVADLDGDGRLDVATANKVGNDVTLFLQLGGVSFAASTPDSVLGDSSSTPAAHGVALGDLDADGDLDLATANQDGTVSIFLQIAPAVFMTLPSSRIGGDAQTAGAYSIAAADLNGDGRLDLITANRTAKSITAYLQRSDASFPALADVVLGGGALVDPVYVAVADLDGDGDLDVGCADQAGNHVCLFHQLPDGSFPSSPDTILGSAATTKGPAMLLVADLNGDGAFDLVASDTTGNSLAVFFQGAGGTFHAAPDLALGGSGATNGPVFAAASDLDGDGFVDLACANQAGDNVTLFFATGSGTYAVAPSLTLSNASMKGPTSLSLEDVDLDGSPDVLCGCSTSTNLVLWLQENPRSFPTQRFIGGAGFTNSPVSLWVIDLDGDGDRDLVSAQPALDNVPIYFGAH